MKHHPALATLDANAALGAFSSAKMEFYAFYYENLALDPLTLLFELVKLLQLSIF